VTDAELREAICEQAYLEGDFMLRSGKRSSYYLDKYRFETEPKLLAALGERLAGLAWDVEPEADRLAGPELGAVALAAATSLSSGLPFVIVRKEAKEYGTGNRVEGPFSAGERVLLVEDVVTSGGALLEAVRALREAGLECRNALCVIDREEGGADALARQAVRLRALFRAREIVEAQKTAANPHG
jgi:orotate phosphoribosyltransferase